MKNGMEAGMKLGCDGMKLGIRERKDETVDFGDWRRKWKPSYYRERHTGYDASNQRVD